MPRPLLTLEPTIGQTLIRDGDTYRVIARNGAVVLLKPDAGGDPERYLIGTPTFAPFQVV